MADKILVAIADYFADEHIFNEAVKLAKYKGQATELFLLHVLPHGAMHDKAAKEAIQLRADEAIALGFQATALIAFGDPGLLICQYASEKRANFIVMGHRSRATWTELALGSVSAYVTQHAPRGCSVLVVRPQVRIVVAMENRQKDEYVFKHAQSLAKQLHARMNVLHILTNQENRNWGDQEDSGSLESEELQLLAHETTVHGFPTEFELRLGEHGIGKDICEYANNAEVKLIVIGRHQHPSLSEKLLGSVSDEVVRNASCSVMVVHPPENGQ